MTAHPPWCDPRQCTVLGPNPVGVQRGGAHRSRPISLGKDAEINGTRGPLTAQIQQASRTEHTPTVLLLSTGGQPISLTPDPGSDLGRLLRQAFR